MKEDKDGRREKKKEKREWTKERVRKYEKTIEERIKQN